MGDPSNAQHLSISDVISQLQKSIDPSEIISPSSEQYLADSQPWSSSRDLHPQLLVRPKSVDSLAKLVSDLSKTNLRYAVRTQGFGSASAEHVLISLSAFDEVKFNREEEYAILGAGQPWIHYHKRMKEIAPDWSGECP